MPDSKDFVRGFTPRDRGHSDDTSPAHDNSALTDAHLLAGYRASRAPDLFAIIYARHGAMVYRLGCRLTTHRHDAEDVVQAVFALLAQRPDLVKQTLGGWLHGTARNKAMELRRARVRRARREQAVAKMQPEGTPVDDEGLREELDAALTRLEPSFREAVVLRYLEGRSQEEAASIAGCPRGTLSRRASEGLVRLRAQLERRGVVVAPSLLLTYLSNEAVQQLPATLATWTSTHAAAGSAKTAGAVVWSKTAIWAAGIAAAGVAVAATGVRWHTATRPAPPTALVRGQVDGLFVPDGGVDIGLPRETNEFLRMPKVPGSHSFTAGTLTVRSSGMDVYGKNDSCYFVYEKLDGDVEISARVASVENTGKYPKAGVMVRQSLDPGAANVFLGFNWGGPWISFHGRHAAGAETSPYGGEVVARPPYWIKLVRRGGMVRGFGSKDSATFHELGSRTLDLGRTVYVGFAVTSHEDGVVNTSTFDRVTISSER